MERFWSKVDRSGECWVWTGTRNANPKPYGRFRFEGQMVLAHRFAYELVVGPIPEGLHIDHLCRNHSCVRPDHLEPVTPRENTRRGDTGRHWRDREACSRGHRYADGDYRMDRHGWRHCRACEREDKRARRLRPALSEAS